MDSLVPRPYTRACERVWLHKSKSLGPLQNFKVSNEIAKRHLLEYCGSERIYILPCESSSFMILCALAFRTFCNSWKSFLYIHVLYQQDSQSCHSSACRSSTLYSVSTLNLSNRQYSEYNFSQLCEGTIMRFIFNLHSYTYNYRVSALPLAQEIRACVTRPSPLVGGVWARDQCMECTSDAHRQNQQGLTIVQHHNIAMFRTGLDLI